MKQDQYLDYSENLIRIKQLVIEIEQSVNSRPFIQALEDRVVC